jgi:hypothetical protein
MNQLRRQKDTVKSASPVRALDRADDDDDDHDHDVERASKVARNALTAISCCTEMYNDKDGEDEEAVYLGTVL